MKLGLNFELSNFFELSKFHCITQTNMSIMYDFIHTPYITSLQEEMQKVQRNVENFCQQIEQLLWAYKEEEFQHGLKFVKDKDSEWARLVFSYN